MKNFGEGERATLHIEVRVCKFFGGSNVYRPLSAEESEKFTRL